MFIWTSKHSRDTSPLIICKINTCFCLSIWLLFWDKREWIFVNSLPNSEWISIIFEKYFWQRSQQSIFRTLSKNKMITLTASYLIRNLFNIQWVTFSNKSIPLKSPIISIIYSCVFEHILKCKKWKSELTS
jgi:hypothetical protein